MLFSLIYIQILPWTTSRKLIFARINIREETYLKYLATIKFSEIRQKYVLPVAISFSVRLKKVLTKLNTELVSVIQRYQNITGIKFPELSEFTVLQ